MIKRHKLCFSAANLILSQCLFMTGMYLRRSILPLRWIVFSSHTATLLLHTLQHNNYLKYLTKFSLWFFLPRNIYINMYAYEILFLHSNDRKKILWEISTRIKIQVGKNLFMQHIAIFLMLLNSFRIYPFKLYDYSKIEK